VSARSVRRTRQELVYVLAFILSRKRLPKRIGRRRIETIAVAGIPCVVERRRALPAASERALRDQHRVVVALHERVDAMLPVRFGALLDLRELEQIVRQRRALLLRALRRVRGRLQMTVRVFGEDVARAQESPPRSGAEYLQARARASRPDLSGTASAIRSAVRTIVVAESIERGRGSVGVVINHLIRRDAADRYRSRIARVLSAAGDADAVVVSGPWPPFAFTPDLMDVTS
jgi:hypothetical protein